MSKTCLVSVRFPENLLEELRALARIEAVRRNEDLTWVSLLKEAAERLVQQKREPAPAV